VNENVEEERERERESDKKVIKKERMKKVIGRESK
jgi:hypothetical protein